MKDVLDVFTTSGYSRVKTPTIEPYDGLVDGLVPYLKDQVIKFFDHSGELVMLRTDHTTPIAKLVASRYSTADLPLRLYYSDPVFRAYPKDRHRRIETQQAGVELVGVPGVEADAEVVALCIESVKAAGYPNLKINLGHSDFVSGLDETGRQQLLRGDFVAYGQVPKRGGIELVEGNTYLTALYTQLEERGLAQYVQFDTGLVRDLTYYSGLVFKCYVEGVRGRVGSGGRYDALLGQFGLDVPAVGFAINLSILDAKHD